MGLKVSRQSCSSSDPCSENSNVSGCQSSSQLKSVGIGSHQLQTDAANGFIKMYAEMPEDVKKAVQLTDTYRPLKVQCKIFDFDHYEKTGKRRKVGTSGTPVATPGGSNHGWGRAIDISPSKVQDWIKENGPKYGWCWGEVKSEPWHFTFCGPGPNRYSKCDSMCKVDMSNLSSSNTSTDSSSNIATSDSKDQENKQNNTDSNSESTNSNSTTNKSTSGGLISSFLDYFLPQKNNKTTNDTTTTTTNDSNDETSDKNKEENITEEVLRIQEIIKKIIK